MKIKLNGIIKDYTSDEVNELHRRGYRFRFSKKEGVNVPVPIVINEDGINRDTAVDELVRRKEAGEKFLKVKGQSVYAPIDAQKYTAIMRPIWREDKREKRNFHCIFLLLTAAGRSERAIAESLGFRSKESVRKRKAKFLPKLQKRLKNFF